MARTPRTFSRRGRAEAKAGKNIGQDKPRKDVTEKAMQRIQREAISEVSLTRSPSRFVGVLRLPRLRTTRFHGGGLPDDRTWREGVLSLKHRRCNETKEYHRAQQSPHENDWLPGNQNVHRRPPGTKSGLRFIATVLPKRRGRSERQRMFVMHSESFLTLDITPGFILLDMAEAVHIGMRKVKFS
jgi:hypothetical protein